MQLDACNMPIQCALERVMQLDAICQYSVTVCNSVQQFASLLGVMQLGARESNFVCNSLQHCALEGYATWSALECNVCNSVH